jgi:hypothetical protein
MGTESTVVELAAGAAGPGRVIAAKQKRVFAIAADAHDVYWINLGNDEGLANGDIRRCPIVNGSAACDGDGTVVAESRMPRSIALDAKAVYWTNSYDGNVFRLAR